MKSTQTRAYQALRRVDDWAAANPTLIPVEVQPHVVALTAITTVIGQEAAAQAESRRRETAGNTSVKAIRQELRVHRMAPLAHVARLLLTDTPELRAALALPAKEANGELLIAAAQAMAKIGAEHEQLFIQHGLSATFVADLRQQATTLQQAIDSRGHIRTTGAAAAKGLQTQLAAGRKAVHALDVALTRVLRHNPTALASWKSAKRVTLKGVQPNAVLAGLVAHIKARHAVPPTTVNTAQVTPATSPVAQPVAPPVVAPVIAPVVRPVVVTAAPPVSPVTTEVSTVPKAA